MSGVAFVNITHFSNIETGPVAAKQLQLNMSDGLMRKDIDLKLGFK